MLEFNLTVSHDQLSWVRRKHQCYVVMNNCPTASGQTFGELIEDRVWAVHEIQRLKSELESMKTSWTARGARQTDPTPPRENTDGFRNSNRLLRLKELRQMTGLARSTVYKMVGDGRFPKPVKLSERARAWRFGDVLRWQAGSEQ